MRATRYIDRVTNKANLEASNELFIHLVEEAHKRGMKVILDGVFNHCGSFNKWLDRERIYEAGKGYEPGAYVAQDLSLIHISFAENLCREYDVPFYLYSCPVEKMAKEKHLSTEEAGRAARQEVFAACAKEQRAVKIALAHHQDDVAETMLHHLARGTSLAGLASLRPVRGNVIRPLLCVGRKEIRQELESRKCSWCEDLSLIHI